MPLPETKQHGKIVLDVESDKDSGYVSAGAMAGGFAALAAAYLLHIHNDFLRLLFGIVGLIAGAFLGYAVFQKLYVKDMSWRRPIMDSSWDEHRAENRRRMGRK